MSYDVDFCDPVSVGTDTNVPTNAPDTNVGTMEEF
jgi:hypothetical protein